MADELNGLENLVEALEVMSNSNKDLTELCNKLQEKLENQPNIPNGLGKPIPSLAVASKSANAEYLQHMSELSNKVYELEALNRKYESLIDVLKGRLSESRKIITQLVEGR